MTKSYDVLATKSPIGASGSERMTVSVNSKPSKKTGVPLASRLKKGGLAHDLMKNKSLYLIALPGILFFLVFCYLPMIGIIIAFKDYNAADGIFASKFVWFNNFRFLFVSGDALRITFNTLYLNVLFIGFGTAAQVGVALLFNEVKNKAFKRISQSMILLPYFISWVVVGVFAYYLFANNGVLNSVIGAVGIKPVQWYSEPQYWPAFLTLASIWKSIGFGSIIYLAAITGMDQEICEAAVIDGCNRGQLIWHITLPTLLPTIIILTLLSIGRIFYGDFGMIYNIVKNNVSIFKYTDVIDTYVYRSLMGVGSASGSFKLGSAAGVLQSFLGFVSILGANWVVKRINSDYALF